ncbi:MAG: 5-formyltetrahydrofolate cyclo-ligase [Prevotella sp.]|nr:5-formyltetrahydrofolate cyclo-ligase [Prevotella sp.]
MDSTQVEKADVRKHIRQLRKQIPAEQLHEWSATICEKLLNDPLIMEAHTIMAFYPLPDEVDIRPVIKKLHRQGKSILLPRVTDDTHIEFLPYNGKGQLHEGAFHIMEPHLSSHIPDRPGDVYLIPGMAFTTDGKRLGRGRGYYDRYLASLHSLSSTAHPSFIGICYPFQIVSDIPVNEHDILMNEVVF